jgi:uncharacterized protein involved in type VI secretion and phage assembly
MKPGAFATPRFWLQGAHIGVVVSIQDPDSKARIQVQIMGADADNLMPLWARVAVPFAGSNRGCFMIPDVGDEVLVFFIGGDPRFPVVAGALWNGQTDVPESVSGQNIDRWTITGKNGTRIAIVEESQGQEKVEIETPNQQKLTVTDASGGQIKLTQGGNTITLEPAGITIQASSKVDVKAATVNVSAGMVKVDAGMAKFSGVVQCTTLIASSVVSSSYTPGAGNIW